MATKLLVPLPPLFPPEGAATLPSCGVAPPKDRRTPVLPAVVAWNGLEGGGKRTRTMRKEGSIERESYANQLHGMYRIAGRRSWRDASRIGGHHHARGSDHAVSCG